MLVNVCDVTPRQAVRSISAITEECGMDSWSRDAGTADAALERAVLRACRGLADVGGGCDCTVSEPVRERMLSALGAVDEMATGLLRRLEWELGQEATTRTPGWLAVLEVLEALQSVGQLGGLLWGRSDARQAVA